MNTDKLTNLETKLVRNALLSRYIIIGIQIAANFLLPNHDAGAFLYPKQNVNKLLDPVIDGVLGGFVRWDAQYFMHITINGYTYENTLAFFPLLPMTVRALTWIFSPVLGVMSEHSLVLIVYVTCNVFFFIQAARALYRLTTEIFDSTFARTSVLLFCLNPASIFFTAPYTESLFSYLTFSAIYYCSKLKFDDSRTIHFRAFLPAVLFIALSVCTRSNGILNIGFLLYFYVYSITHSKKITVSSMTRQIFALFLGIGVCLLPFVAIQLYFHRQFCADFNHDLPSFLVTYAETQNFILPGMHSVNRQQWCDYSTLPLPYQYVQEKYWNVGFLRYYELKQIPNFLLALPAVYIVLLEGTKFLCKHKNYLSSFTFLYPRDVSKSKEFYNVDKMFVCVVHAVALTLFCVFFVNVQVTTRMLCSGSPVVYWFSCIKNKRWIKYYYCIYVLVGTVMFSKFLPWT